MKTIENIKRDLMKSEWIAGKGNKFCRKVFNLQETPRSALLYVIADKHEYAGKGSWMLRDSLLKYRLFLNGEQFGAGPFRPIIDTSHVLHKFEVSSLLKKGKNVFGVISRGSLKGFALLVEIILSYGKVRRIRTGPEWRQLDVDVAYNHFGGYNEELLSNIKGKTWLAEMLAKGEIGPGELEEHIQGDKYPDNWLETDYDDSAWSNAETHGKANDDFELWEGPNYELNTVNPAKIDKISKGHFFIDFGRELIAGLELDAPPVPGKVEIRLGEELCGEKEVRYLMRTGNHYRDTWTFTGNNKYLANFGLRTFRYAEIINWNGELQSENIRAVTVKMPFRDSDSSFKTSSCKLEEVWQLCKNTIKTTTMDIYQDCPSRERIAYEADTYINMLSHFAVDYNPAIAKRTFEYQLRHPTWPCEWRQLMLPIAYEYLMHTGDYETVERNFEFMRDNCSFHKLIKNGLIRNFPMKIIIDWPEYYRDGYEIVENCTVANAFAFYDLVLLAKLSELLNKNDASQFRNLAAELKSAVNEKLYDSEKLLYRDGSDGNHCSFHANMFALCFGLVPQERVEPCLDFIIKKGMICSVYAAQFYLETLFKYNCPEAAIALMEGDDNYSTWLGMIKQGATTTMEAWHPDHKPNLSWAHPWATAPANIIARYLFGLRPTVPGWQEFIFEPKPGKLASGSLTVPTPRGKLTAYFKRNGSSYKSSVKLEKTLVHEQ